METSKGELSIRVLEEARVSSPNMQAYIHMEEYVWLCTQFEDFEERKERKFWGIWRKKVEFGMVVKN